MQVGGRLVAVIAAPLRVCRCAYMQIKVTDSGVEVGAAVTLSRMMRAFRELMASRPRHQTSTLEAVVNQLRWVLSACRPCISTIARCWLCLCTCQCDLRPSTLEAALNRSRHAPRRALSVLMAWHVCIQRYVLR